MTYYFNLKKDKHSNPPSLKLWRASRILLRQGFVGQEGQRTRSQRKENIDDEQITAGTAVPRFI
jgi:hypothetical protein